MENKITEIINYLNNQDWTKNEKIRYAYIELGKNLHLNAKFFYSLYQLLDKSTKYSLEELNEIYTNVKPTSDVICKNCAIMLKMIFDRCGIESEIKKTCEIDHYQIDDGIFEVQHFFLCVTGDNDEKYFLSLALDLPYIQMGMQTEHFATNIVYKDGAGVQVYEGEEIHNIVMDKNDIRKLDEKIGYLSFNVDDKKEYFNESFTILREANKRYKEYFYKLATSKENTFYNGLINIMSEDKDSLSVKLSTIDIDKWNQIKKYICTSIKDKISIETNKIDTEYEEKLNTLLEKQDYENYLKNLIEILKLNNLQTKNNEFNLFALTTNTKKLFDSIDKIKLLNDYDSEEYVKLKNLLNMYILKISIVFIDKKYQPTYDNSFSNEYIANKIKILFPDIFDFNYNTDFTNLGIGEKTKIIERVINSIFPELSMDKASERTSQNPVENRIRTCMIYDKEDREYKLLIAIDIAGKENAQAFIYNFNNDKNYFEPMSENLTLLSMRSNKDRYIFLSKSYEIRAQENIESKKRR